MNPLLNISDISSLTAFEFESLCRNYNQYAYLNNNIALCRILSKYKIYVDVRDESIAPHLIMDGFWETWLTQCLAKIVKPGNVCIDIGANFGYYSVLMSALAGKEGQTLAVEPNPGICKLLRATANVHSNHFDVAEVALSNKVGKAVLYVPNEFFGDASITERLDRFSLRKSKVKVKTITLDELLLQQQITKVDVIKMDVEGLEPLVFEGMQQTLAQNPDVQIIIEYSPYLYSDARTFTNYLFANFTVHKIKDVDEMVTLDESFMEDLIRIKDHTDLYLQAKPK